MKKIFAVLLVFVLLAVAVTPALAAGKPPANSNAHANQSGQPAASTQVQTQGEQQAANPVEAQPAERPAVPNVHAAFVLTGKVTAVNPAAKTVVVTVTHSNAITRKILGASKTVTLTVTAQTRILKWTKTGTKKVTLSDLAVGDVIMAQGRVAKGVWTAQRILIALGVAHRP